MRMVKMLRRIMHRTMPVVMQTEQVQTIINGNISMPTPMRDSSSQHNVWLTLARLARLLHSWPLTSSHVDHITKGMEPIKEIRQSACHLHVEQTEAKKAAAAAKKER
mmetsp:Transcript_23593/g.39919  ORF Transcript_23593/g.39919 Transcript_23593/m.39919 type:complete len:107 (-) Transcript_23593:1741-2061(-)